MTGEGRPKTPPKPPERNDYVVTVLLLKAYSGLAMPEGISGKYDIVLHSPNKTKGEVTLQVKKLTEGFITEIDGLIVAVTPYNIATIYVKKEKSVTDAPPESDQGQSTAADGVLSAHPTGL